MIYQKILKKWLNAPFPEGRDIIGIDDSIVSLLLLRMLLSGKDKIAIEVPGFALGEKLLNEIYIWAASMNFTVDALLLPDGISSGKHLAESEIPRAQVLDRVLHDPPQLVICSAAAELSPAPAPEKMLHTETTLRPGMNISPKKLAEMLTEMDYDDELEVVQKGEFARRGGLMDIFSPNESQPARIDFFGDEIESIRLFSEKTQLSTGEVQEYKIIMRSGAADQESDNCDFAEYIRRSKMKIVTLFPENCLAILQKFGTPDMPERWQALHEEPIWKKGIRLLDEIEGASLPDNKKIFSPIFPSARHILSMLPDGAGENYTELVRQISSGLIRQLSQEGYHIVAAGNTEDDTAALHQWLQEEQLADLPGLECIPLMIPRGFLLPADKLAVFSEYELYSSPRRLMTGKKLQIKDASMPDFRNDTSEDAVSSSISSDLEEGDYAVHINYGIGIYHGIKESTNNGITAEFMELEFAEEQKLLIPLWQAHCVSRYIGAGKRGEISLSKIGTTRWNKLKSEAAESVRTLALDMLKLHAIRCQAEGTRFPDDDLAQNLFEKSFPFTETTDQLRAIDEVKKDMEAARPMDRLLCGDVGYGKTEIAMRAVFKCVMAGRQAAILVPTTVLAQQHYYNFLERFAEYPVIIELLCRFRTRKEQNESIMRLKAGKADIVIGTHRLLQKDVEFHDLGLVVIDEEQRFGVKDKEVLKKMRATVDVLTMTATPIPRTLYFSMSGMRDLSTLMSAPVHRLPVQTVVSQYDENLVKGAISRELQRGGQVYYLYNRVKTIDEAADNLRVMFPDAKIEVGHGQMEEHELEQVMGRFIEGKTDILVCTTIIESGLDIPNANTILIERADRFGLAELYQLRGRVGRWQRQAYAYLLLPKNTIMTGDVRKRIAAMRKYTHLGAGFKLALRDLEIRGAGNILGAEQSGHINAIGFSLYCDLLKMVTSQMKGTEIKLQRECNVYLDFVEYALSAPKTKAAVSFPPDYINSERLRIEAYRRLAICNDPQQLEQFRNEIIDRFGRLPESAENLFLYTQIRLIGVAAKLNNITCAAGRILLDRGQEVLKIDGKIPILPSIGTPQNKLRMLKTMLEKFLLKKTK